MSSTGSSGLLRTLAQADRLSASDLSPDVMDSIRKMPEPHRQMWIGYELGRARMRLVLSALERLKEKEHEHAIDDRRR